MKRVAWALMSALFFGLCGPALADPYIYFIAHPPKLDAGQNLLLDVNVAGLLPDVMGGFQITLEYDPRLILLTGGLAGAGIGTALGDVSQGQAVVGAVPPTPDGRFTFFEVSLLEGRASTCVFCTGPYLEDLQADSFRLATLAFYFPLPAPPGPLKLTFNTSDVVVSDENGTALAVGDTVPLVVAVAEPPTLALVLGGLILLAAFARAGRKPARFAPVALLLAFAAHAQAETDIPLQASVVALTPGRYDFGADLRAASPRYAVMQFDHALTAGEHASLPGMGLRPVSLLFNNAWICAVLGTPASPALKARGALAATPWKAEYKLTKALQEGTVPDWARLPDGAIRLLVRLFPDRDPASFLALAPDAEQDPFDPWVWHVSASLAAARQFADSTGVESVSEAPEQLPTNDGVRAGLRVDAVQQADLAATPPIYRGLSGLGVRVAITEWANSEHPDFFNHDSAGRQTTSRFLNPGGGYDHGTHVAGTIAGNGWNSDKDDNGGIPYQWRGMAPEATLVNGPGYITWPVDVSNHSMVQSYGAYNSQVAAEDRQINGTLAPALQRPHIWSAANQGVTAQYDREVGYYSMFGAGKNIVTVGALNVNDQSLAIFSSLGPTFDGRIKPDVTAPGCRTYAPRSLPAYTAITTEIDYVRVYDSAAATPGPGCAGVPASGAAQPVQCFEFAHPGDAEGWFQTEALNIFQVRVEDGLLRFDIYPVRDRFGDHPFGFVNGLDLAAAPSQFVELRYRYAPPPEAFEAPAYLFWRHAHGQYVDGALRYAAQVDGQFHVVRLPVGETQQWSGSITALRIDPLTLDSGIFSTSDDAVHYLEDCGTSMATPAVTGAVALVLQRIAADYHLNLDDTPPLPSTLKAVLAQTATDLVHPQADPRDVHNPDTGAPVLFYEGPDFATGYGEVNAEAADALVRGGASFDCATTGRRLCEDALGPPVRRVYRIEVPPGAGELRVTLAWDDVAANSTLDETLPHLVNDLDLVLLDPSSAPHYAWTLAPLPIASCRTDPVCTVPDPIVPADVRPAHRARDHRNNLEQVTVPSPQPGVWHVLVEGYQLQDQVRPQRFSLAASAHRLAADGSIEQLTPLAGVREAVAPADLNADACVDRADLLLLTNELHHAPPLNASYDLNGDGHTDVADARYLVTQFSRPGGAPCQ